jgi:hypothetical protein
MSLASGALRLSLALVTAAAAGPAAAQRSSVTFTVFAAETQQALAGAQLSVDGHPRGVSDARGVVRVEGLAPGTHRASVSLLGRIPRAVRVELAAGEEREVLMLMEPLAVALPGITAAARERSRDARIEAFYRRAQSSSLGRFVTRAQIEEKNALQFTDIFRGVPGMQVVPSQMGETVMNPRAATMGLGRVPEGRRRNQLVQGGGACPPRYFVDGSPYPLDEAPLNSQFSVADIEGVEIYPGNVPPQWGGSRAMCGVIVIWTRTNAAPARGSSDAN